MRESERPSKVLLVPDEPNDPSFVVGVKVALQQKGGSLDQCHDENLASSSQLERLLSSQLKVLKRGGIRRGGSYFSLLFRFCVQADTEIGSRSSPKRWKGRRTFPFQIIFFAMIKSYIANGR